MTAATKGYTFTPETQLGSANNRKYTFVPENVVGKGQLPQEEEESFWKSSARTALQVPQGFAEMTTPGLIAGLWQLLGQGEVLDPEEIEHIKAISEREGIPFDEEAYMQAAQEALGSVPTVSNIARGIEERTGLPLEPKTGLQKATRFGSSLGKIVPGTALQKAAGAGTGLATKEALEYAGVPEPFAELAGFGTAGLAGVKTPEIGIEFGKRKPSGMPERGFEALKETREVPARKIQQISDKLEKDFKTVSDKIIKESPIGETAERFRNDPFFKRELEDLLNQAQTLAEQTPGIIPSVNYKKALVNQAAKQGKGFALGEYEKNYIKYMQEASDSVVPKNLTNLQLVEQYRKNTKGLKEYFEPGASPALNRAKRDALLDQNRAISAVMEESSPELSKLFKTGNEGWTKLKDIETIDNFVNDMFPEGKKIDYKHMNEIFDDPNYQRIFKRALGEKGTKAFEQAVEDMLTSKKAYGMLREAKDSGWRDVWTTMKAYAIHPHLAAAKSVYDAAKWSYRTLFNATLDKPRVGFNFTRGVNKLKKGDFKAAQQEFNKVSKDVELLEAEKPRESPKTKAEPIEIEVEPIKESEAKVPEETKLIGEKPKEIEAKQKVKEVKAKPETKKPEAKPKKEFADDKYYNDMIKAYEAGKFKEQANALKKEWKQKKEHDVIETKKRQEEMLDKMIEVNLRDAKRLEEEAAKHIKEGRTALAKRKLKRAKDIREFQKKLKEHP